MRLARDLGPRPPCAGQLPRHRQGRVDQIDADARLHLAGDLLGRREIGVGHRHQEDREGEAQQDLRQVIQGAPQRPAPEAPVDAMSGMLPVVDAGEPPQAGQGRESDQHHGRRQPVRETDVGEPDLAELGPRQLLRASPENARERGPVHGLPDGTAAERLTARSAARGRRGPCGNAGRAGQRASGSLRPPGCRARGRRP